jgi:ketosteroid isomerase-like protein
MARLIARYFSKYLLYSIALFSSPLLCAQQLPKAIESYTQAWNESNNQSRMDIIVSFWTEKSLYEDPGDKAQGRTAFKNLIDKFWQNFPGASFEMGPVLSKGNFHTWSWKIFDQQKNLMLAGVDYAETNDQNQMLHLIGFWDQPQKKDAANVHVVKMYYENLFKKGDFTSIAKIITEDAVYHQASALPYGGTYKGFTEWMQMFTKAIGYFDLQIEKEPQYFVNDAKNEVVMQFTIHCTSKKSGQKISMPVSEQFELKDHHIVSIRPFYFDTKAFAEFLE